MLLVIAPSPPQKWITGNRSQIDFLRGGIHKP